MKFKTKTKSALKLKDFAFPLCSILLLATAIMIFSFIICDNSTFRLRTVLFTADAAVLFLPYWFVRPRLRWIFLIVAWIAAIFLFANALFFTYWGDLFPLRSIFDVSNYNSFVFNSIPHLLTPANIFILLIPCAITALYFLTRPDRLPPFSKKLKICIAVLTFLWFTLGQFLGLNSSLHWRQSVGHPVQSRIEILKNRFGRSSLQFDSWKHCGLIGYIINRIPNTTFASSLPLDDAQRLDISRYIYSHSCDSTFISNNYGKNLIFIIVESLNASLLDVSDDSHKLMPVLSSLAAADSVISSTAMRAQIAAGGSSDGQFIYNTGLLPLLSGAVAQLYGDNDYPSLIKALRPASSAEFIVEKSAVYNHRNTSKAYGYATLCDADSLNASKYNVDEIGYDKAVLSYAFDKILEMPQPFVAEITTLSMHFPFDNKGFHTADWIDSLDVSNTRKKYYQTAHYTDGAIGQFLSALKDSPLADNTIVVIASDHDCNPDNVIDSDDPFLDFPTVLIVYGSGTTLHHSAPIGQVDVFPTLLDVMGVPQSEYAWRGLGKSLLSSPPQAAVSRTRHTFGEADDAELHRINRAFALSDSLIRSNFFSR